MRTRARRRTLVPLVLAVAAWAAAQLGCGSSPTAGGTSDNGNARVAVVSGRIVSPIPLTKTQAAQHTRVAVVEAAVILRPHDYCLVRDRWPADTLRALSDTLGEYHIEGVGPGTFVMSALHANSGMRALRPGIVVDSMDLILGDDSLRPPGALVFDIDSAAVVPGAHICVPGTDIAVPITAPGRFTLDSLPAGLVDIATWSTVGDSLVSAGPNYTALRVYPDSTVLLVAVNTPPRFSVTPSHMRASATVDSLYTDTVSAGDSDLDNLAYRLLLAPPNLLLDSTTGAIRWRPTAADVGEVTVSVRVVDNRGGADTLTWTITVSPTPQVNTAPRFTVQPENMRDSALVDSLYRDTVTAVDDENDTLRFRPLVAPAGFTVDSIDGTVRWRPSLASRGSIPIVIHVLDNRGGADTLSWTVEVSLPPPANTPPRFTVGPGDLRNAVEADSLYVDTAPATDNDSGDTIRIRPLLTPAGCTVDSATGEVRWRPGRADTGLHTLSVRAVDPTGDADTLTWTVTVTYTSPVNAAPRFTVVPGDMRDSIDVDSLYLDTVVADDDDHDDILRFRPLLTPTGLALDSVSGTIQWRPNAADAGEHAVSVRVGDNRGGADTLAWTITVTQAVSLNTPPRFTVTVDDMRDSVDVDFTYLDTISAVDNDAGDVLRYRLLTAPAGLAVDSIEGVVRWDPTPADLGPNAVSVKVVDNRGGADTLAWAVTVTVDTAPTPARPAGDGIVYIGAGISTYRVPWIAPDGAGSLQYRFAFGGDTTVWGPDTQATITWQTAGTFSVRAQSRYTPPDNRIPSDWSPALLLEVRRRIAPTPTTPAGVDSLSATFNAGSGLWETDPTTYKVRFDTCNDGSALHYRFAWGDGDTTVWAADTAATHVWQARGSFEIRAQTRTRDADSIAVFSEWSLPRYIVVD